MTETNSSSGMLDSDRQQQMDAGLQPFKLVKYFSFSSLAVILIFTLFLSWVISNNARKVMLKQSEEYSLLLAENLNQQVFRRFVLPAVVRYGNIALSNPEQFEHLDKIVRAVIQGMKIDSVTIYDSSVNIISYSTILDLVGKKDVGGSEYRKSLEGIANSRLSYSGSILNLFPGASPVQCELVTFIPFRQVRENDQAGAAIMGVIEIVKDLSNEYTNIIRLQASIIGVSSMIMMVLFLVLRSIVSHAGKIMERRALERLRLEEKLNQSERLAHLGTMVATVSHEIKNPLGIVRSTGEILEKRIKKVAPGSEHLARIIVNETSRLNDIVVEFLDFARPQQPKFKAANLNQVVEKVLTFISHQLQAQDVVLTAELADDLPEIILDGDQMYRALLNILMNSLQAMEHGGSLRVATSRMADGTIRIIVADSGAGMNTEKVEHIFKPFFSDKNKGTGLGLAITLNIIQGHNGTVEVESEPNVGTTFTIILPGQ